MPFFHHSSLVAHVNRLLHDMHTRHGLHIENEQKRHSEKPLLRWKDYVNHIYSGVIICRVYVNHIKLPSEQSVVLGSPTLFFSPS